VLLCYSRQAHTDLGQQLSLFYRKKKLLLVVGKRVILGKIRFGNAKGIEHSNEGREEEESLVLSCPCFRGKGFEIRGK
jgi:hypothetical protein